LITLKQLEALHWIATLGTFERAASRLCTTQSAISKRIHELEAVTGLAVFDRSRRGTKLTEKGESLLNIARNMLHLQGTILNLADIDELPARRIRLGITELSTLTWFPHLIAVLAERQPNLTVEPDVDTSRDLYARLNNDELDIIVVPEVFSDADLVSVRLATMESCWVAKPGVVTKRHPLTAEDLTSHRLICQGRTSGFGLVFNGWLRREGIQSSNLISCDNMIAILGLAQAGIGIASLPIECCRQSILDGKLELIETRLKVPSVNYVAMYSDSRPSALITRVVELLKEVSDFSLNLQS
jgi:DNA-binding transcriptional LysR family regulator